MPANLPLTEAISQDSESTVDFRIIESRYGNGYSQRAADGINNIVHSWTVNWQNLTVSEFNTVVGALEASAGTDYFTWQAPGDSVVRRWMVGSYSKSAASGDIYSVSATLKQVFDL